MELLLVFILTAVLGTFLTSLAIKLNIIDEPNYRKIHTKSVPKAGGIGFIIPVLLVLGWYYLFESERIAGLGDWVIAFITLFLLVVGIVDDKYELSAKRKLQLQLLAAVLTVGDGTYFHLCNNYYINYVITVIWIVGFINAMNLIDGLDGLAGGIGMISSAGILFFASQYSDKVSEITAAALIGGLLGFLFWNRHPAKIFMGDTGSLPLGFLLASLIIRTGNAIGGFGGAAIALFMVLVPVYDTLLSIIRRKINRRPVFAPDRSHFYNLLMDRKGLSHKNTVRLIYVLNLGLVVAALLLEYVMPLYRYVLAFVFLVVAFAGSIKAGFLKVDNKQ